MSQFDKIWNPPNLPDCCLPIADKYRQLAVAVRDHLAGAAGERERALSLLLESRDVAIRHTMRENAKALARAETSAAK